jgi:hypothetical protein
MCNFCLQWIFLPGEERVKKIVKNILILYIKKTPCVQQLLLSPSPPACTFFHSPAPSPVPHIEPKFFVLLIFNFFCADLKINGSLGNEYQKRKVGQIFNAANRSFSNAQSSCHNIL